MLHLLARTRRPLAVAAAASAAAAAVGTTTACAQIEDDVTYAKLALLGKGAKRLRRVASLSASSEEVVENWSGTHSASPKYYFTPTDSAGVQSILDVLHEVGARLRIVGSALSPNGLGLSDEAMMNVVGLDSILHVDKATAQVRVQAGARVSDVVEALRPHKLTLQNYASIAEQQIGGFMQVGAHGTGAAIPPVDEQVVAFKLHTPGLGELNISEEKCPKLFHLAKVSFGWLGVVSEVTLQCVPAHKLLQHTFVETREGVARRHAELLAHQHVRYMWIPHTDTVVVVTCDPIAEGAEPPPPPSRAEKYTREPEPRTTMLPVPVPSVPSAPLKHLVCA